MKRAILLPAAFLVDQVAGDPEWFPHPVRAMGAAIEHGEALIRRDEDDEAAQCMKGLLLSTALVASTYILTQQAIALSYRLTPAIGRTVETLLGWTCLAARNLHQEAESVSAALDANDLALARLRIARIVGRDTAHLDTHEISRALIETLAESASDGVVAPMFYLTLGGAPLAMAYKAVNTLDSMIGHRNTRYQYFGRFAARLDDAANFIPARLTALYFVLTSAADAPASWATWRRDGSRHKSPNAGQPEAALAGALGVCLGGSNTYDGELIAAQRMGEEFAAPTPAKARDAIRATARVAALALGVCVLFAFCRSRHKGEQ
ncbi:adenosylcobinamide-phosphate synthase [Granulicella pectinivorans]|jgi:adenosylcobinamide-phosphate synthase|uniref:Cobalamin biosynthesis protein CobD n=1 Tax=Granulicella pectinivorans TaxID=474950 RepID=A0A1I6MR47_9BACT|nr:adenosylcobinamide-phosphate synthase CbiB [Granulicella pectinivorans]SFS18077.1 adenosylcobinamide-phosphate synthase [Granulicella pectinivorans]